MINLGYIDPGTGSLIGSTIIGLGIALVFSLRGFFYNMVTLITGQKNSKNCDFEGKIVFFNEGKNYWTTFKPVVENLIEKKQEFVYLTADENDPGLKMESPYMTKLYLGSIITSIYSLNRLKAAVCVMTTPQLNILTLKRSSGVAHYCHLLHAAGDIHTYKKFAFDYFDSVLCASQYVIDSLIDLETQRKTPPKKLYKTGCVYYDIMNKNSSINNITTDKKTILLAPTWGEKSYLAHAEKIIETVLGLNYNIILRPHPQSWISDIEIMNELTNKFSDKVVIDRSLNLSDTLSKTDVLICDISGIVHDFAFIYKKPVIAIVRKWANGGYEDSDISRRDATFDLLEEIGATLNIDDINKISEVIENIKDKKITSETIEKHCFNFGNAAEVATQQILEIYNSIKK